MGSEGIKEEEIHSIKENKTCYSYNAPSIESSIGDYSDLVTTNYSHKIDKRTSFGMQLVVASLVSSLIY